MNAPDLGKRLTEISVEPLTNTPAEFARFIQSETPRYAGIVRDAGIKPQ